MVPAPIALFAYNRPDHLLRTLSALKANRLAKESTLYIFSDGPKTPQAIQPVAQVREIIKRVDGFAEVLIRDRTNNIGLAQSVIEGVTELSAAHGSVIVLEDDLVVAPGFLTFMNQSLQRYEWEPAVMAVSGYLFPVEKLDQLGSTFFCRVPTSWGWGTWHRAWKRLEVDSLKLLDEIRDRHQQEAFNLDGAYPYFEHLKLHAEGKLDVWGVRWYASMFRMGGLCLYPNRSLVQNIGMDGSGIHCAPTTYFDVELSTSDTWTFPSRIEEAARARAAIRSVLLGLGTSKRPGAIMELVLRLRAKAGRITQPFMSSEK